MADYAYPEELNKNRAELGGNMSNDPLEYKGFFCAAEIDYDTMALSGKVLGTDIIYSGVSVRDLIHNFRQAVDEYLEEQSNKNPKESTFMFFIGQFVKSKSGKFYGTIRARYEHETGENVYCVLSGNGTRSSFNESDLEAVTQSWLRNWQK